MKVMVIVKATPGSERGEMPTEKLIADMTAYNEQLLKAGIMKGGDGLKPSSFGKRVRMGTPNQTVTDGPFAETKELLAGFWLWEVKSMEEAVEWVMKCPDPMPSEVSDIEIRPFWSAEELEELMSPELKAREEKLRQQLAK